MKEKSNNNEAGYALLAVIIFVAVSALVLAQSLNITSSSTQTAHAASERSSVYYESEETLAKAATWLRSNSEGVMGLFHRNNFYNTFERTDGVIGSNDPLGIPTRLRLRDTDQSVLLATGNGYGNSVFPEAVHPKTGNLFDALEEFNAADFGLSHARITLVDAIGHQSFKDFGDPADGNLPPKTDFRPVFRVDALTSIVDGSHVFGYVLGDLSYDDDFGFFGKDFVQFDQFCDSYHSEEGAYGGENRGANCRVGSTGDIQIHQSEAIYGLAKSNTQIDQSSPWGGQVCADFACEHQGEQCSGEHCAVGNLLPEYESWETYCPDSQGNVNINNGQLLTLTVASDNPSDKCWNEVKLRPNSELTLTSTEYPYFIETFDIHNNGQVKFVPDVEGGVIDLYVKKFVGDGFNASQMINTGNPPTSLRIHYLGTDNLLLNGNAEMHAFIVAPNAGITVSGNFDFYGGIKAKHLVATGAGNLHYDESGDQTELKDVKYAIRRMTQQYRQ